MNLKHRVKSTLRGTIDRVMVPYVAQITESRLSHEAAATRSPDLEPPEPVDIETSEPPLIAATSDFFHMISHELRNIELERVPKGSKRVLSVGPQGRWYFDWFEKAVGKVDEHVGIEAFEPMPDDLPDYVTWIPDTADHMLGVASDSMDLVFAGQTSEHLWAHELSGFLEEANRVLHVDGLLVLDSPNQLVTEHLRWSHGGHTIEMSVGEMTTLLQFAGFDVISTAGIWSCRIDGQILQLEEQLQDPSTLTRRISTGRENPDDCFIWWINARRSTRPVETEKLRAAVAALFGKHWDRRVSRGLFPNSQSSGLTIEPGISGIVAESLPFPLHKGTWEISAVLVRGSWDQLDDVSLSIVSPGNFMVHSLPISAAVVSGETATWTIEQPHLLFALAIQVFVGKVRTITEFRLPLSVTCTVPDSTFLY